MFIKIFIQFSFLFSLAFSQMIVLGPAKFIERMNELEGEPSK